MDMPIDLFSAWQVYLAKRKIEHNKQDYALAKLCQIVYNALCSDNKPANLEDFLIIFKSKQEIDKEEKEITERRNKQFMSFIATKAQIQKQNAEKAMEIQKKKEQELNKKKQKNKTKR